MSYLLGFRIFLYMSFLFQVQLTCRFIRFLWISHLFPVGIPNELGSHWESQMNWDSQWESCKKIPCTGIPDPEWESQCNEAGIPNEVGIPNEAGIPNELGFPVGIPQNFPAGITYLGGDDYLINETRRKPTTRTRCPTLFDKWHRSVE